MKIIEESKILTPHESSADSISTIMSPLTLFDYPWLMFPPLQPLLFFRLPSDTHSSDFTSDIVPRLKRSLSSALQYYFPIAGKLAPSVENPVELTFVSNRSCAVDLTVAFSDADLDFLSSYLPRDNNAFHELVPSLPSSFRASLFAVQITYFPSSPGFSIGIAFRPVLCDQRCFSRFLHLWGSFCKYGCLNDSLIPPSFDRSIILDSNGLIPIFSMQVSGLTATAFTKQANNGLLRATFVMSKTNIQNAKRWIMSLCDKQNRNYPVLLSPYIVVCAFVWASLLQSSVDKAKCKGPMYFGFIAGGITRVKYRVPLNYFGNCVGFGHATVKKEELLEKDGILAAADTIAMAIKALDTDILGEAENWISKLDLLLNRSEKHVNVVGSPKVELYKTDFGWGRPMKIEEISIDVMKGISLTQSSDMNGGMEIGLALTKSRMEAFCDLFNQGLRCFSSGSAI